MVSFMAAWPVTRSRIEQVSDFAWKIVESGSP
jgi:hypothetical protein